MDATKIGTITVTNCDYINMSLSTGRCLVLAKNAGRSDFVSCSMIQNRSSQKMVEYGLLFAQWSKEALQKDK